MQPIQCPHCGAPPPPQFTPSADHFSYTCVYCKQVSVLGTPAPEPPPPAAPPPTIIVVAPSHDVGEHHRSVNVARSASWLVWLVLVVGLGGGGAAFTRCGKHSSAVSALVWSGKEPLECSGNDDIAVSGVEATFTSGSAIVATGNCRLRCTDCKISAPTAIEAAGNAQVTIINGSVIGTSMLAEASGNARVNISGNATASGRVHQSAGAKISAPSTNDPAVSAPKAAPSTPAPVVKAAARPTATATTNAAPSAKSTPNTAPSAKPTAK